MSNNQPYQQYKFFLACFNVLTNQIYFTEYFSEEIIKLDDTQKKIITSNKTFDYSLNEKERNDNILKRIEYHKNKWDEIKLLSGYEAYSKLNQTSLEYFKRPIFSNFLFPENIDLYQLKSTFTIPSVYQAYGKIPIKIIIDFNNCFCEGLYNYLPEENRGEPFCVVKKVSFLAVVDTIIIEALYELKQTILEQKKLIPRGTKEEKDFRELFEAMINDKENKFVLKLKSYEEYFYGDYPLGTYESIRKNVREYETTSLYLYKKSLHQIKPPISYYPPIIPMSNDESINYFDLYDKYIEMYPINSIVYRMFEPCEKYLESYLKRENQRDVIKKYGLSSHCDFPLKITVVGVRNINELEKWMDNEIYNRNEMMLPYFEKLTNLEEEAFLSQKTSLCGKKKREPKQKKKKSKK